MDMLSIFGIIAAIWAGGFLLHTLISVALLDKLAADIGIDAKWLIGETAIPVFNNSLIWFCFKKVTFHLDDKAGIILISNH